MSTSISKLDNYTTFEEITVTAQALMEGARSFLPKSLKKPEEVAMVVMAGQELGLNATSALRNIHLIQGMTALSVHAIAALLKKKGMTYKIVEDYLKLDANGNPIEQGSDAKAVDVRTTIRFIEYFHGEIITNDISFTWSDAAKMDLTSKENWQRMPKIMLRNRCLAIGARFAAPDAFTGIYTLDEVADMKNVDYSISEEGEVVIN